MQHTLFTIPPRLMPGKYRKKHYKIFKILNFVQKKQKNHIKIVKDINSFCTVNDSPSGKKPLLATSFR